jgi:hypothetical protein
VTDAAGLSGTHIARLTNEWEGEYRAFQKCSLDDRDYVYVWVDGVHFNVRLEGTRLCTLVTIQLDPRNPPPSRHTARCAGRDCTCQR